MRGMAREYAAGNSLGPGLARVCGDLRLSGGWVGQPRCRQARSGMARSRALEARLNWCLSPRPAAGRCRVNRRAERVSRPTRAKNRRLRVLVITSPLAQTDARCPAGDVVGHHLDRQPGGVGGEAARGEVVQPHTVLEVSDGILDLGVAAMVSLQFELSPPGR